MHDIRGLLSERRSGTEGGVHGRCARRVALLSDDFITLEDETHEEPVPPEEAPRSEYRGPVDSDEDNADTVIRPEDSISNINAPAFQKTKAIPEQGLRHDTVPEDAPPRTQERRRNKGSARRISVSAKRPRRVSAKRPRRVSAKRGRSSGK